MASSLLPLPVAAPLLAAGLLLVLPDRPVLRRVVAFAVTAGVLAVGGLLLAETADGGVVSQRVGDWPAGVSIVFAADQLSALLVAVTALVVTGCLGFAAATGDDRRPLFVPLVLVLTAGVYGAYFTADLFNLFVFVEVMLAPSYVLVGLTGGRRAGVARLYLTVSLLASTIFLAGVGLVYGATGTVNLGELAAAAGDSPLVAVGAGVILVALATKAAVVPVHTWLPRVYAAASPAVAALFSGLLTKVGVYAIFRLYAVVYDGDPRYQWVILTAALASMVVGALGSAGEPTIRTVLVFSMVSHIGFMMVGPGLSTAFGLAAAVFYLVQYILVKAALLMCAGAVETTYGTGALDRLGGLVTRAPLLSVAFMVSALSLAGIPPLSGFVAKLGLVVAAVDDGRYLIGAVVAGVGIITLLAMSRVWTKAFWGHDGEATWAEADAAGGGAVAVRVPTRLMLPALLLAASAVVLGVGAQPLLAAAETAAAGLVDPAAYVEAVIGP